MKILIVGNGGREHAILSRLERDAPDATFFITIGNGGTGDLATSIPLSPTEIEPLADWAARERIDLTVVGPEIPLSMGIVDSFRTRGLPIFGPTARAAAIESSKAFAKDLMRRYGIPTAGFRTFADLAAAEAYVHELGAPLVVKASGLAAGKGAVVCDSIAEAVAAVREMLAEGALGEAGRQVVIEQFMRGEELSVFALCDGENVVPLLASQDHKRVGEGDSGPNTGGMGAYAPVSIATPSLMRRIINEILTPTIAALADEGRPFSGLLYAGLMIAADGPKVVEFNARFGDPETQVVLPLLDGSLLEPMLAVATGSGLGEWRDGFAWRGGAAVTTVLASAGYPGKYPVGVPIDIPDAVARASDVTVFHAGTARRDGRLVTSGGRVLAVTGVGADVASAAERSRWGAERITFEGAQFRRDIGWREIAR